MPLFCYFRHDPVGASTSSRLAGEPLAALNRGPKMSPFALTAKAPTHKDQNGGKADIGVV